MLLRRAPAPLVLATLGTVVACTTGTAPGGEPGETGIHHIQGTTRVSPLAGERVDDVPGVVTAVNQFGTARGFWFQDPRGDSDPRTSEALFVFTGSTTPDLAPGDSVTVSGTVQEHQPGGADSGNQTITQMGDAQWRVLSSGAPPPEPELLAPGTVPATHAPEHGGDVSDLELRPEEFALDYWESREHMLVRVEDARVVGPTDAANGLWVTTEPERNSSARGGTVYGSYTDPNPGRLRIESLIPFSERPFPQVNVGDELRGSTEGPLYYSRSGGYLLHATTLGAEVDNGLPRLIERAHEDWELSVATYNVENLSPRDDRARFAALAEGIVEHLRSPDILCLQEIQDNSGPDDDGTVRADQTLDQLAAAIKDAGGPAYQWREIPPEDGANGGQPGGNIRNAFLVNPTRVDFVDVPGGDATTAVEVSAGADGGVELSASPGLIHPRDPAWENSRSPLAGQFTFQGRDVIVVANHFTAKGGDQPMHGAHQPPERASETQRHAQAGLVRQFTDDVLAIDPDANLLVAGDLNDYWFSSTLEILTGDGGLLNPMTGHPPTERYTHIFDGNSQALDHILIGSPAAHRADHGTVRINAEFHDQASDHDPLLLRFRPLTGDAATDRAEDRRHY